MLYLPHAIANRLAARALEDTPYELIDQQLVTGGTERLARSFSRRLAYLHEHPCAVAIAEQWFAPGGLLGDVTALNHLGWAMFENVAPVLPEAALAALERAGGGDPQVAAQILNRHSSLLRSLAYDPQLFKRSASLLTLVATQSADERDAKEASDTFISLFTLYLSGTHATIEQRVGVVEQLLLASEPRRRALGLAALDAMLKATGFVSSYRFEFGGRSRDYGFWPRSSDDITKWYGLALALIERLAFTETALKRELGNVLARNFRGLWKSARTFSQLESLANRFAADGFWREGWAACRETLRVNGDRLSADGRSRLVALEANLRPADLADRVRAVVLADRSIGLDLDFEDIELESDITSKLKRLNAIATELGATVAANARVFEDLLPELLRGGNRIWEFGRGLARASDDRRSTWSKLVEGLGQLAPEQRNVQVLHGYLAELWEQDRQLAQDLLDAALNVPNLATFIPALHSAVQLDVRGIGRLKCLLSKDQVPIEMYRCLASGRTTDLLAGSDLRGLLQLIAERPDGFDVALEILFMRLFSDRSAQRQNDPQLLEAGRDLLRSFRFGKRSGHDRIDYRLAAIVRDCLNGPEAAPLAVELAGELRRSVAAYETYAFDNDGLLRALLAVQPMAVLDALFKGDDEERQSGIQVFEHLNDLRRNPADEISCKDLIAWCDQDPQRRYPLAASFVTFARRCEEIGSLVWSEQAKALLAHAPDAGTVLAVFIERFRPMSWSGSRAAAIDANARLLDNLDVEVSAHLMQIITSAKAQLAQDVAAEREHETAEDRVIRDERFE